MRNSPFWWVIVSIMILLDFYVFQAIKVVSQGASHKLRLGIYTGYWAISIAAVLLLLIIPFVNYESWPKAVRTYLFATIVGIFFAKAIAVLFFLMDDIRRLVQWLAIKLSNRNPGDEIVAEQQISRSAFLSWLGLIMGGGLFATLMYGFRNKYRYDVRKLNLAFAKLPAAFKGLRIVHISDIHSGSFMDRDAVQKGVDLIMSHQPDLILFTGDLVNDRASEMEPFMDIFNRLNAPFGVYSTLGNHDYGDYISWESREAKRLNLEKLKQVHADLGWKLLMNEHVVLEKENDTIAVLGIENWSARGNFSRYGSLQKAYAGSESHPFKILLSHDPSHWDAEVRTTYQDIDLMLAGHTHGMQFGVEIPGFRWSPVQWFYKQWAGLYEQGNQKLYVNRGFGFIGYPGRVGILPEITVIELG